MTNNEYNEIIEYLRKIIHGSQFESHVFVVGGALRSLMLNDEIKDIDMCIDLPCGGVNFAEWIEKKGYSKGSVVTYPTYGTAMFHLKEYPNIELECVQTRKEQYKDRNSRKPETAYGTILEDAMRRDLTINALYYNISEDKFLDVLGRSYTDMENHVIRVTSDPNIVFSDDALRILRCIRYATRFGWDIEETTFKGMKDNVDRLQTISQERITDEFNKMLLGDGAVSAMRLLYEIGALKYISTELEQIVGMEQNKYHFGDVWEHTLKVLDCVVSKYRFADKLEIRLAALFHDIGKITTKSVDENGNVHFLKHELASGDLVDKIMARMRYPNSTIKRVKFLVVNHMRTKQWGNDLTSMKPRTFRKLIYDCKTMDVVNNLFCVINADNNAHADEYCMREQVTNLCEYYAEEIKNGYDMLGYRLPVNGKDIMCFKGIDSGVEVKKYLDYLLKLAFNNPKITKEQCLKSIKSIKL